MNATGLRDQRIKIYKRHSTGTDGFQDLVFVFDSERWGRLDSTGASVTMMRERLNMKLDAAAEFSDEASIPVGGLVVDSLTGDAWWVRGIYDMRQLRRVTAGLERIALEAFKTFTLYDNASDIDGTHVVNP